MVNLTMLTDFYQLTMMDGYLKSDKKDEIMIFDMFYRKNPNDGGYTIVCGINEVIDYIENLKFEEEDIQYLKSLNTFDEEFLQYLRDFKFDGEIYAVEEGTIMFPNEPIIRVKAKAMQAQLVETTILCIINFQTLIATKASRICYSAMGDSVMEFGLRRAQAPDAGLYGAKAAVIGGCIGTSNVLAGQKFDIPVLGTHAHSWIQSFDTELDAFRAYAKAYPTKTVLLLDTYDTLNSGIRNAITVFNELREQGYEPLGVRIDSGDLEFLSKEIRKILDSAGFENVKITASNDLDENTITSLKNQGAQIDIWGVGTKMITSFDWAALGGVYKLCAVVRDGQMIPKIKISEDPNKINNPGYKNIYRIYDKNDNKAKADLIVLDEEVINENEPLTIFDPIHTWKKMTFEDFYVKKLLLPLFIDGKCVREKRDIKDIKRYTDEEKESFWIQYRRNKNPQIYKVDLSKKLWNMKNDLLENRNIL
ncbi:nicotinate phosphoribosyltransferase [Peptoanaerobacter stomatis]|uniref:Nicotinate phosphoribosyltransferase n=1 Tax=Peptoanaerobacter stomatis TaxID=796937 RepID=J6HI80_9FIRM|nr:nicotinate phosphoribosyltransferase [Peptoanaerobacter stomatis]EJU24635.1 nicotinate phosphoribosyltransferase [Peptoanaerobacter stomatis]NWO25901.1 nicotinate phosphoribosyltransferase [Peptostreptococcaceae bacterium oral taxon 081]